MRIRVLLATALIASMAASVYAAPNPAEQDLVDKFLNKNKAMKPKKQGWLLVSFAYNRINRHNDYNDFTQYVNSNLSGGKFSWLNSGNALGLDFGMVVKKKFAWSIGAEYWLKMGQTLSGTFTYTPPGGAGPVTVTDPSSKISLYGAYAGLYFYPVNPPSSEQAARGASVSVGGTAGYYSVSWDLFPQYQNLNLATSAPEPTNTTYKGSAPGFTVNLGLEYPLNFHGLAVGGDIHYLYLNFDNVSWYNSLDQEVVATYGGTANTRVSLGMSGIRAKVALKRYFSW